MPLHLIHSMGIKAWCSDLIIDPEDGETVYFMSVAGYQVAVKGIVANLLEDCGLGIAIGGKDHYLKRSSYGYKILTRKLPSGFSHMIVIPKPALPDNNRKENRFIVLTTDREELKTLFFRHLDDRTDIPLHPSWAPWLWKTFERQDDWIVKLQTLAGNYIGYLFDFNPEQLHDLVSTAIRKRVPAVFQCMVWKGGTDGTIHKS